MTTKTTTELQPGTATLLDREAAATLRARVADEGLSAHEVVQGEDGAHLVSLTYKGQPELGSFGGSHVGRGGTYLFRLMLQTAEYDTDIFILPRGALQAWSFMRGETPADEVTLVEQLDQLARDTRLIVAVESRFTTNADGESVLER